MLETAATLYFLYGIKTHLIPNLFVSFVLQDLKLTFYKSTPWF